MKKRFLILGTAATLIFGLNFKGSTSSSQPPARSTGAPGENTCASGGCHTGNLNTGSGSVALVNPPTSYVPGTSYTMQVSVTDASKTRFGFELAALQANNQQAGSFTLISATNTALQTQTGKSYVSHHNASSNNTWTFTWQAPATNVGPVTFYMAGNAANANNNTSGDNIYTSSLVLNPAVLPSGIKEDQAAAISMFPNPATGKLNLRFPEKPNALKVLDLAGREVFSQDHLDDQGTIDVSQYPNGTYFLQVEQEKTILLKRFVVQH